MKAGQTNELNEGEKGIDITDEIFKISESKKYKKNKYLLKLLKLSLTFFRFFIRGI
jgi:hypothetical protein